MKLTDHTFIVVIINLGNRIEEVFLRLLSVVLSSGRNPKWKEKKMVKKKRKTTVANDDCSQSVQSVSARGQSSSLTLLCSAQPSSALCLFCPLSWNFIGFTSGCLNHSKDCKNVQIPPQQTKKTTISILDITHNPGCTTNSSGCL